MLIIFDLDDTLIDTSSILIPHKIQQCINEINDSGLIHNNFQEDFSKNIEEYNNELLDLCMNSSDGATALNCFLSKLNLNGYLSKDSSKLLLEKCKGIYYSSPSKEIEFKEMGGAKELINSIKDEHDLIIITKGHPETQLQKISSLKLEPNSFKKIVMTQNYDKTEHYENIMKEFNQKPENILVCGDKFNTDLLPAKNLRMKTVHARFGRGKLVPKESIDSDYSIENLFEMKEIIDKLSVQQIHKNKN